MANYRRGPERNAMLDLIERANWSEFYYFFAKGNPPLALLLLGVNTLFFILWILRRLRGAHSLRKETAIIVQALLIGANVAIMFREDVIRATNITYYYHKMMLGMPF
jgi:hypothetical protein